MSLKTVHIIFILCSIALTLVMARWALGQYLVSNQGGFFAATIGCFLAGGLLIFYLFHILRKFKQLAPKS